MDNNLKKEFAPRDVQRMRNIITGDTGAATQLQSGWEKEKKSYGEGDIIEKKMWAIHGKCFSCVLEMEAEIKRQGKWEEYTSGVMNKNKNAELTDIEIVLDEWMTEKDTFVSEAGEVEKWGGGDKKAIYQQVKERIAELKKLDIYNQKEL